MVEYSSHTINNLRMGYYWSEAVLNYHKQLLERSTWNNLTEMESFNNAKQWLSEIDRYASFLLENMEGVNGSIGVLKRMKSAIRGYTQ
uniref:Uncharacterized protein n=1 Tax=Helianthus annuus TaxID=4232 RepID=A0A251SE08_HELAN